MELAEIEKLMSLVGSFGFGALIGAVVVFLLIKSFLPSYFVEKGKNLATKEDVAVITDKVQSVKTDYAKVLEEIRAHNQLNLAEIEREKNLKKEVYLQAVEALTRSQNAIVFISNLNIDMQEISSEMAKDSGIIAKVQIVGSERTVKAVTTIMASIGASIMKLMLQRGVLDKRKNTIETLERLRSNAEGEISSYISLMKKLNLDGGQDKRMWDAIDDGVKFETSQRDQYTQEINKLWQIQNKERLELTRSCMDRFFEVVTLLPDAVLAVREELNLPISNDAYLDIFNENIEQGKLVFREFFESI